MPKNKAKNNKHGKKQQLQLGQGAYYSENLPHPLQKSLVTPDGVVLQVQPKNLYAELDEPTYVAPVVRGDASGDEGYLNVGVEADDDKESQDSPHSSEHGDSGDLIVSPILPTANNTYEAAPDSSIALQDAAEATIQLGFEHYRNISGVRSAAEQVGALKAKIAGLEKADYDRLAKYIAYISSARDLSSDSIEARATFAGAEFKALHALLESLSLDVIVPEILYLNPETTADLGNNATQSYSQASAGGPNFYNQGANNVVAPEYDLSSPGNNYDEPLAKDLPPVYDNRVEEQSSYYDNSATLRKPLSQQASVDLLDDPHSSDADTFLELNPNYGDLDATNTDSENLSGFDTSTIPMMMNEQYEGFPADDESDSASKKQKNSSMVLNNHFDNFQSSPVAHAVPPAVPSRRQSKTSVSAITVPDNALLSLKFEPQTEEDSHLFIVLMSTFATEEIYYDPENSADNDKHDGQKKGERDNGKEDDWRKYAPYACLGVVGVGVLVVVSVMGAGGGSDDNAVAGFGGGHDNADNPSVNTTAIATAPPTGIPTVSPMAVLTTLAPAILNSTLTGTVAAINSTVSAAVTTATAFVRDNTSTLFASTSTSTAPAGVPTTEQPTDSPADVPTVEPTGNPSDMPSEMPTDSPVDVPTVEPTDLPSDIPTDLPSDLPTGRPTTSSPTAGPTVFSTQQPSTAPPTTHPPSLCYDPGVGHYPC